MQPLPISARAAPSIRRLLGELVSSRLGAAVVAGLLFVGVALLLDSDGSLGSDTGGKIATVNAMVERNDWSVDIGYWAEADDPDGSLHPFFGTRPTDKGWINVTSLPMILIARALVGVAGPIGFYVFPMVGSVLGAFAVGALAQLCGAQSWRPGFWAAALASPLTIYAVDFWEHSMGVALMVWAVVLVMRPAASHAPASLAGPAVAGVCFGLAATMRQEAYVYGFVAGLVVLFDARRSRSWVMRLLRAGGMAAAALVPLLANQMLEQRFFGSPYRSNRAVEVAAGVPTTDLSLRLQEAIVTLASPINQVHPLSLLVAALVMVGTMWYAESHLAGRPMDRPRMIVGVIVLMFFVRTARFGPEFVPGLFAASPVAALGLVAAWRQRRLALLALALVPIPIVWTVQYAGAASAQWGARYLLTSGMILLAGAIGMLWTADRRIVLGFLAANAALALLGVGMVISRTHDFGTAHRELFERPEPVLVFADPFLAREAAPTGWKAQWLTAFSGDDKAEAAHLLDRRRVDAFAYVGFPTGEVPDFTGYEYVDSQTVAYGSFPMDVLRYVAAD